MTMELEAARAEARAAEQQVCLSDAVDADSVEGDVDMDAIHVCRDGDGVLAFLLRASACMEAMLTLCGATRAD